jgi:hypothetical protein
MNIIYNTNPFFHISIENVFSKKQLETIFEEIEFLNPHFKGPAFTGSASLKYTDCNDCLMEKELKKNTGIFLDDVENFKNSQIITFIDEKIKEIGKYKNWNNKTFKRMFDNVKWGSELINRYDNNDYYKPHCDCGVFTLIFFIWHNNFYPKGGDLYFPEYDHIYKCKNNHALLFFSKEFHGVTPIIIEKQESYRYSVVSFSEMSDC